MGAAQTWFTAGAIVFIVAGGGHALLALIDPVRPTAFAPIDDSVKPVMEGTGMRFRRPFPGNESRPSRFNAVMLMTAAATACFTIAAVLSA